MVESGLVSPARFPHAAPCGHFICTAANAGTACIMALPLQVDKNAVHAPVEPRGEPMEPSHDALKDLMDDRVRQSGHVMGAAGMWHTTAMAPVGELSSPLGSPEEQIEESTDKRARGASALKFFKKKYKDGGSPPSSASVNK